MMDCISVLQASEKWGVSLRQVQRLLAGNRIPGAMKYGRSWMIPADAEKPADPRRAEKLPGQTLLHELRRVIAATTVPMPGDNPDAVLDTLADNLLRLQYEGELAYLRGDFRRTLRCYHRAGRDDAARLRASPAAIAAAVSLGDYAAYTQIEGYLRGFAGNGHGREISTFAELALATAAMSVIAPAMAPGWLKDGDFSALPAQAKPDALYLRAKYFQCLGDYRSMLAVAQTALALCPAEPGVTLPDIYLRLLCAIACHCLERDDEAKRWLMNAMDASLPHGFVTPFAESVSALGGLTEHCLQQAYPGRYDAVVGQWESTWKNWISFHNQFTKENITHMLTLREYHIALLVSNHVPYARIARQFSVSVGRLKNIMLEIYEKLFVSGRDELSEYIL